MSIKGTVIVIGAGLSGEFRDKYIFILIFLQDFVIKSRNSWTSINLLLLASVSYLVFNVFKDIII